jgi:hypothetical protein
MHLIQIKSRQMHKAACMRAAFAELDEGEFTEGHELDRKWRVPKVMIGRRLSREEVKRWLGKFFPRSERSLATPLTAPVDFKALEFGADGNLVGLARSDDEVGGGFLLFLPWIGALQPSGVGRALWAWCLAHRNDIARP